MIRRLFYFLEILRVLYYLFDQITIILQGKFLGRPGEYNRVWGYRQEECGPGGCLMELCIQLAIIMVGKQAVNTLLEMLYPYVLKLCPNNKLVYSV